MGVNSHRSERRVLQKALRKSHLQGVFFFWGGGGACYTLRAVVCTCSALFGARVMKQTTKRNNRDEKVLGQGRNYSKRGSASFIVREVRSVRERERE